MTASRVALVTEDAAPVRPLADFLEKSLAQAPQLHSYASIREILDRDADGLLVLLRLSPNDTEAARHLIQHICLQKLPPVVVLLDFGNSKPVGDLERYVARCARWPED